MNVTPSRKKSSPSAPALAALTATVSLCATSIWAQPQPSPGPAPQPGPVPMIRMVPPGVAPPAVLTASLPISDAEKNNLIALTVGEMNKRYVFPDVAKRAGEALRAKLAAKGYDGISDGRAFAEALSADLLALTKDKHVRYEYSATPGPQRAERNEPTESESAAARRMAEQANFGIERVERLAGNIGYVDVRLFHASTLAGDTVAAAMALVAHTDALIIDLRRNMGGHPETVALMTSYLFDERKLLNSFTSRNGDRSEQSWSLDWVPGKRFGSRKPVYVLTSKATGSAGEEFAYNLKHMKRAKVVGQTTAGAANIGNFVQLTPQFSLFIPDGRVVHPVTKTNWEGVGVEPDVNVEADDALRTAQLLALTGIIATEKDPRRAAALKARLTELERSGVR